MGLNGVNFSVGIDYLTMSFKHITHQAIIDKLCLHDLPFVNCNSYFGCDFCLAYNGIKIHYTYCEEKYIVILDLSGKGCRMVEEVNKSNNFDWFKFFQFFKEDIINKDVKISRIDIAGDVYNQDFFTIEKLIRYVENEKFISKSKYYVVMKGNQETAIYFGSPKSDRRLRIYDKALEQHNSDSVWVRLEFQLRNDSAISFVLNWFSIENLGKCYSGVMFDFLRFTTKRNLHNDKNQSRLAVCTWWINFLNCCQGVKQAYLKGNDYTIDSLRNYIAKGCSSSIKTYIQASRGDCTDLFSMIDDSVVSRKQQMLLNSLEASELKHI